MFEDMIRRAMEEQAESGFKSRTEAADNLKKFLETPRGNFKVGDYIEMTEVGKKRYNFPKQNQAAIVINILPERFVAQNGDNDDIAIMVAVAPNHFRNFTVDSRFYQLVNEKTNIFSFRKK